MAIERPTLVAVHAHPDDEAIFTGGLLARAARAGRRTVVVLATSGDAGSTPGYEVADRGAHRRVEAEESCRRLGVDRLVVLRFHDSGVGRGRSRPGSLAAADPADVLVRLDDALTGESPTAYTTYDRLGVYRHRDHVAVHLVGALLAEQGVPVYEATVDRRHLLRMRDDLVQRRVLAPWRWPADVAVGLGGTDELLHLELDDAELAAKVDAVAAHGSQVAFAPEFMGIPPGAFDRLLAHEWYRPAGPERAADLEALLAGRLTAV